MSSRLSPKSMKRRSPKSSKRTILTRKDDMRSHKLDEELHDLYLPKVTFRTRSEKQVKNILKLNWNTPIAIQRANELVLMGYQPNSVDKNENGHAIWTDITGWTRIVIYDKPRLHFDPKPHADVMYSTAKVRVPADKRSGIRFISQTAIYDELNEELTAGCHFMGASIATLGLVKRYAEGDITKERAQSEYGRTIARLAMELEIAEEKGIHVKEIPYELEETGIWERYVTGENVFGSPSL